jgi:hypothetical protein
MVLRGLCRDPLRARMVLRGLCRDPLRARQVLRPCLVLQLSDRLRTSDAVDLQTMGSLEPRDCPFGKRAVAAVDRARHIARPIQATLQRAHALRAAGLETRAGIEHGRRRCQCCERLRAGDAVDLQAVGGLEARDCLLREGPIEPVDRAGRLTRPIQATLQRADAL